MGRQSLPTIGYINIVLIKRRGIRQQDRGAFLDDGCNGCRFRLAGIGMEACVDQSRFFRHAA